MLATYRDWLSCDDSERLQIRSHMHGFRICPNNYVSSTTVDVKSHIIVIVFRRQRCKYTDTHACTHVRAPAHIHTRMHTDAHTQTHLQAFMHTHTHTHARTHIYTHAHTYTHTHTHSRARTYTRTHTHTHAQRHTHTRTHTHTRMHTHTHTQTHTHSQTRTHACTLTNRETAWAGGRETREERPFGSVALTWRRTQQ